VLVEELELDELVDELFEVDVLVEVLVVVDAFVVVVLIPPAPPPPTLHDGCPVPPHGGGARLHAVSAAPT